MNNSTLVKILAAVFLLIGILGFVPALTPDGNLLGIFSVDMMHNIIHILTGVLGFVFAGSAPKTFLKGFGIVYLLVTVLGFAMEGMVMGMMMNGPDNLLHLAVTIVALVFGFMPAKETV